MKPVLTTRRIVAGAVVAALLGAVSAEAAKNPDKPGDKPKKIEKYERKLERAGLVEAAPLPDFRQAMAATAPSSGSERSSRSERSERSSKSDRGDRSESSDRSAAALPADPKFDGFRIIAERNIFNPTRVGRTRATPEEKPPKVDEISLVGTMQYDKGVVAFFDSTDAQFRKNLKEGDTIAGYKVGKISTDGVELTKDDKTVNLQVAQQLRRREGGEWTVTAAPVRVGPTAGADAVRAAAEAAATAIPPDASEALKRLMEKRKQQLSK